MYLSAIIFLPVIGAIIIALIRGLSEKGIRWISVFTFILALSIYLLRSSIAPVCRNHAIRRPFLDTIINVTTISAWMASASRW
jgi:NADH:ubiquinone oxidoreductase subunit 4 (subunit M)